MPESENISSIIFKKVNASFIVLIFASAFLFLSSGCSRNNLSQEAEADSTEKTQKAISDLFDNPKPWMAPDTSEIPKNDSGRLILYGRKLIANTAFYLGPHGSVKNIANGMNCQNCHLDAGTKLFANSFAAVASTYPRFRPRSGSVESVEKRVNDCLERSMNGKKLDSLDKEMRAMVAYILWVGKNVEKGKTPKGTSIVDLPYSDHPADPAKGNIVYSQKCVSCHGDNGEGKLNADGKSYQYPPLWGADSYNTAAGLFRISRFAGYIKSNMPYLTSSNEHPVLTDDEAWDVAAFVNSMPRPDKDFAADWPDISKKPVDHPFGPFSDSFSELQHKYGPFAEIESAKKKK